MNEFPFQLGLPWTSGTKQDLFNPVTSEKRIDDSKWPTKSFITNNAAVYYGEIAKRYKAWTTNYINRTKILIETDELLVVRQLSADQARA